MELCLYIFNKKTSKFNMVEKAEIGGEVRPLRVTNGVNRKMFSDLGIKKEEELEKLVGKGIEDTFKVFETKLFYALEAGYKAEKKEFTITKDDVREWVDDMTQEEFFAIPIFKSEPEEEKK
jgi:hypothetical protein